MSLHPIMVSDLHCWWKIRAQKNQETAQNHNCVTWSSCFFLGHMIWWKELRALGLNSCFAVCLLCQLRQIKWALWAPLLKHGNKFSLFEISGNLMRLWSCLLQSRYLIYIWVLAIKKKQNLVLSMWQSFGAELVDTCHVPGTTLHVLYILILLTHLILVITFNRDPIIIIYYGHLVMSIITIAPKIDESNNEMLNNWPEVIR